MNRKRPLLERQSSKHQQCCSFCQSTPVVMIEYSNKKNKRNDRHHSRHVRNRSSNRLPNLKPPPQQLLCLLHFYTTDACRNVTSNSASTDQYTTATIIDPMVLRQQLPPQQELFAEAYLQIQQQIQDVMQQRQQLRLDDDDDDDDDDGNNNDNDRNDDPLAIITDLNKGYNGNDVPSRFPAFDNMKSLRSRMHKVKPTPSSGPEGGFLRHVPTPERIVQVQLQQVQQQQELIDRMYQSSTSHALDGSHTTTTATSSKQTIADWTQRRKPTRTNVWNIISHEDRKQAAVSSSESSISKMTQSDEVQQQTHEDSSKTCTCGSTKVEVLSSNTNKSQDMTKAETWGNKDRHDEIIHRYLCHHCGKTWNDVE